MPFFITKFFIKLSIIKLITNGFTSKYLRFFSNIIPDSANKIQAWSAVLTTGIAGFALISWKQQKHYEIYLQGIGNYQIYGALIIDLALNYLALFDDRRINSDNLQNKIQSMYSTSIDTLSKEKFFSTLAMLKTLKNRKKTYNTLLQIYIDFNAILGDLQITAQSLKIKLYDKDFNLKSNEEKFKIYSPLIEKSEFTVTEIGTITRKFNGDIGIIK